MEARLGSSDVQKRMYTPSFPVAVPVGASWLLSVIWGGGLDSRLVSIAAVTCLSPPRHCALGFSAASCFDTIRCFDVRCGGHCSCWSGRSSSRGDLDGTLTSVPPSSVSLPAVSSRVSTAFCPHFTDFQALILVYGITI